MKTLDEVIKKIEACIEADGHCPACPYEVSESCGDMDADALHYLKEYRGTDENYKNAIAHVTEIIDHYEKMVADYLAVNNPPLTWKQLKQMEGKPVWIEERNSSSDLKSAGWWLIDFVNDGQICLRDQGGNPWNEHRSNYGRDWQAYRKERK